MSIKMKSLIKEESAKERALGQANKLDAYVGQKLGGKKIDGWEVDWEPRESNNYFLKDGWRVIVTGGDSPAANNLWFTILDDTTDLEKEGAEKFQFSANLSSDYKRYLILVKKWLKMAEKAM